MEIIFGEVVKIFYNVYGVVFFWQLSDYFVLGGWGGFIKVCIFKFIDLVDVSIGRGSLDIWNWVVILVFFDIIKEGNMVGIIVGM